MAHDPSEAAAYSLGAVVKLTGLSEHTLRAWEARYGAIRPARTPKGTRRYGATDVARLRLLRDVVRAGHRIGEIAELSDAGLEARLAELPAPEHRPLDDLVAALDRLDLPEVERLLGLQLGALGPEAFCREIAAPLLHVVGDRWQSGVGSVASEHLLTSTMRGMLAMVLRASHHAPGAPVIVFTTPSGERHELGALIAAVVAVGAGADVRHLGPELPVEEVVAACATLGAQAVALSLVTLPDEDAHRYLTELRAQLPASTEILAGGAAARSVEGREGMRLLDLDALPLAVRDLSNRKLSKA